MILSRGDLLKQIPKVTSVGRDSKGLGASPISIMRTSKASGLKNNSN